MSEKWEKSQAGYVHFPKTQYECLDCCLFLAKKERCSFVRDTIRSFGSCNLMAPGPSLNLPELTIFSKAEAGYAENPHKVGLSCKRCEEFSPEKRDCLVVDKNSRGDDPGEVHPDACCDHWELDPVRGGIPTMAFALHQIKK